MSTDYRAAIMKAAAIEDRLQRALHVVGLWTELLKPLGIRPIVVGGTAVEFYSFGAYNTYDVDVVTSRPQAALDTLKRLGFKQTESLRHWYHEQLQLVLEIPGDELAGSQERVSKVEVGPFTTYVIGLEDLIMDRLRAYVHWDSPLDGEWVHRLVVLHEGDMDWPYLLGLATEEGLADAFKSLVPKEALPES